MKIRSQSVFKTDNADVIYQCILPELQSSISERLDVNIKVNKHNLLLDIHADDIISMRSALNTWLRLIKIADDICSNNKNTD